LNDDYKRGYADAMNWKVQNHLEHLPPAQREWIGLTDAEIWQTVNDCTFADDLHADKFARAIEAKLKEKNT
jgi:hypothetical protein